MIPRGLRRVWHAGTWVPVALATLHAGCSTEIVPATQVMVVVDADPMVRASARSLDVRVDGPSGTPLEQPVANVEFPVVVAVVPEGGDATRTFTVSATARDAMGSALGTVRARTRFVEHSARELDLLIEACCGSRMCTEDETCRSCACVALTTTDPAGLPTYTPPDSPPDPTPEGIPIEHDLDDGELDGTGTLGEMMGFLPQGEVDSNAVFMGGYAVTVDHPGLGVTYGYFRFTLDRPIRAADDFGPVHLRVFAKDVWSWIPGLAIQIRAEVSADAGRVTSIADAPMPLGGRTLTDAEVRWPSTGDLDWPPDTWQESPDLSVLLREVATRAGDLPVGAHVQLFVFRTEPPDEDGEVAAEDFSHPDDHAARLWFAP